MELKTIALRSGIHISKVKEAYTSAMRESAILGTKSERFIYETMEEILDINSKSLSSRFIESSSKNFDSFLESLISEEEVKEEMMSTDFSPSQKPEGGLKYNHKNTTTDNGVKVTVDDEEEKKEA